VRVGLFYILLFCCTPTLVAQTSFSKDTVLMGSAFRFTAKHTTLKTAETAVNNAIIEVIRIEKLISSWDKNSETSNINRMAGIQPVQVSFELFSLINRAIKISEISNGYYDISFASIDKIWDFNAAQIHVPYSEKIKESIEKINYKNIILNPKDTSVYLNTKGMKIGFGSIGKGYAANKAKQIMLADNILSGVVNAGGDLIAWGSKSKTEPWSIGIADPFDKTNTTLTLTVEDMAVVTSGNYEKYLTINGKRYCHIINPKTGWPVTGLASTTIICRDAEIADALSTTVFILGLSDGMQLINHLDGIEGIIIEQNGSIHYSNTLKNEK